MSLDVVSRRASVDRRQPTVGDATKRRLVKCRQIFEDVAIDGLQALGLEEGREVVAAELHARPLQLKCHKMSRAATDPG